MLLASGPGAGLIERYRDYLMVERDAGRSRSPTTCGSSPGYVAAQRGRELDELSAATSKRILTSQCRQVSTRQAERLATGLRSFLGFALVEGLITRPLTGAVPSVARWSGTGLPRGLTPTQTATLLASCDRRQAMGRRDYAILVLLVRPGLRAAEVPALRLDDIDWRAGEIIVRGKGRTEDRLPTTRRRRSHCRLPAAGPAPTARAGGVPSRLRAAARTDPGRRR
jgi:integrase